MSLRNTLCLYIVLLLFAVNLNGQNRVVDLSGKWQFEIDREDVGVNDKWFVKELKDQIVLPGSMTENLKGDDVTINTQWTASIYDSTFFFNPRLEKYRQPDNLKIPFWLTPVKYYVGAAWYKKEVEIPASWKGERVELFLERPHTETRLWINGKEVGMQNSLSVPHVYEVSKYMKTGQNTVALCIDNRTKAIDVGKDSHSITDQTQGNWNGVVGKIELRSRPHSFIEDMQVFPDVEGKKAIVKLVVEGSASGEIKLEAESFNGDKKHLVKTSIEPDIESIFAEVDAGTLDSNMVNSYVKVTPVTTLRCDV